MSETPTDESLTTRLERLSRETDTCSFEEFQAMAAEIKREPAFERRLIQAEALANENRLLTLALLHERGSLCACEIQAALDCTNATVSHHMDRLVQADLVTAEQCGKWKHYALTADAEALVAEVVG